VCIYSRVEAGKVADVVLLSRELEPLMTMVEGEVVYDRAGTGEQRAGVLCAR